MSIRQRWLVTVMLLGVGMMGGMLSCPSPWQATLASAHANWAHSKPDAADPETIRDLIKQLGDDSFSKREAARKRLVAIGEPALDLLRQAARDSSNDLELSLGAQQAVQAIEKTLFGEVRRFAGQQGEGPRHWSTRVVVTPDGRQAVSCGDGALACWDVATGKQILSFGEIGKCYWSLALSGNGRWVIAGGEDNAAHVWDRTTGKELRRLHGHSGPVWGVALSADGRRAVTGAWDQSLLVWDVVTGKVVCTFEGVRGKVRCLALSPDGKLVAAGHFVTDSEPGTIRLWDVEKGKEIRAFEGHERPVSSITFSPDSKTLLSSSFDRTVRLWDVASAKELKRFTGHTQRVEYAAWNADGSRVVSCGNELNGTLRLWDVASGKQIFESEPVVAGFLCVAVLPDGRHCVTTSKDGVVRLWRWAR